MVQQLRRYRVNPSGGGRLKKGLAKEKPTEIFILEKALADLRKELELARRVIEAARTIWEEEQEDAPTRPRNIVLGEALAAYDAAVGREGGK